MVPERFFRQALNSGVCSLLALYLRSHRPVEGWQFFWKLTAFGHRAEVAELTSESEASPVLVWMCWVPITRNSKL